MFDGPLHIKRDYEAGFDPDVPPPDKKLQKLHLLRQYIQSGKIPWRAVGPRKQESLCNSAFISKEAVGFRNGTPFPLRAHRFVPNSTFQKALRFRFLKEITRLSVYHLKDKNTHYSAYQIFSVAHIAVISMLVLTLIYLLLQAPIITLVALNTFVTVYFLLAIAYRIWLVSVGLLARSPTQDAVSSQREGPLPVITILLPLYRDSEALASLCEAVDALDYPESLKDVKLLLEEDDKDTINEARRLGLENRYEFILVPPVGPRTKPKACNFGMHLARGELIVIFDAEDQPETAQLRKAALAFVNGGPALACVQAKLNYYNANENWLTRLFALEYSLWFDWLLPALQKINAPIPLGGTSNYFRTDTLIEVGGWDPYNVTEDADLGLRLSKLGYRTEILDSTTYEEANCRMGNWIRQRSRWIKGYVQTWFVHMRRPGDFLDTTGWNGLMSVQLFIAGNVLSALINPILWALFVTWLLFEPSVIARIFPEPLLWLNIFALTFGNMFFILLAVIAPLKRKWYKLSLAGLTAPAYWLLTSVAAYKALWQLIFKPHYWEKTDHQLSPMAKDKRRKALVRHFGKPVG